MKRIVTAMIAAFAAIFAANAARTIALGELSSASVELSFGETDGNVYMLAWGYGDEDGGSATNAWDTFETLGTVAAGDTSRTVQLPAGWQSSVTHLRFFLLAPETLPYATRLEYIQSSGSQWIDTGVRGRIGVSAELDITCVEMRDSAVLCCRTSGSTDSRMLLVHWNANDLLGGLGGHGYWYWAGRAIINAGTRYVIRSVMENGNQTVSVNGNTIATKTYSSTFDTGLSLYLFANNVPSAPQYCASARLYSGKLWLDGNLVRDFVPCKDENGEACLYDLVSGNYFRNGGSGTFAAGAEIAPGLEVVAASALCEPPARTVAVASAGASNITLSFGPSTGDTYALYMAYGAADGGTDPSGWDEFEELGEIDNGDDEYVSDYPAGWGSSVKALRFFLLRSDDSVASSTDTFVYENALVVAAGAPTSLFVDAEYDVVRLRDTLRLAGGTLNAARVIVDGPAGCLDIDGGTFPSTARLSLDPDLDTTNEYATVLALRSGTTTLHCATNANPDVAARIHFLGGSLKCTTFSATPLCSANGGKWILEGAPGRPIRFGSLGMQRMDWLTGEGSVETRGLCDVVLDDSQYNAERDFRGTIYLNTSSTAWNHTGNLVLSNAIDVICRADDCLPCGPQTGGIEMKWVNRAGPPPPRLNLNGHSVAVNGIDGRSGGVSVTNSSSTVATIRIGEGDTVGSITNLVLRRGNINIVKRGAETNFVSIGSSSIAALRVEAGTLVVTGSRADKLSAASLTVADGATLVVDGTVVFAATCAITGAVERVNGGVVGSSFGGNGSADTVVWDDPELAAGNVFAKVGSNRAIVQTAEAIDADIDVQAGELVFSGRTCTNEWYRFVFNGSQYNQSAQIAIGDLRVYSGTTTNAAEDVAWGIGTNGCVRAVGTDPKDLAPRQCTASFATTTIKPTGQSSMNLWDLRNAFDNSAYNAVLSEEPKYIYNNSSQVWVAFRLAAGKNHVQSYLPVKSYITWHWHPSAWLFQTSSDGVSWQTVDTRVGALTSDGYGSTPFVIKGFVADGAAGFNPAANVTVASGATLDVRGVAGGQTLSRLTIDMTAGAGTIRGASIAKNGVLDLVNVPEGMSLMNLTLPVTLLDVANGSDFSTWTVLVEGAPVRVGHLRWHGSSLRLFDGLIVTIW
ncbi:MAG: hypothetical protein K6G91_02755 [Kiritimatiellae bacterium]|nr:hypothetical protein [Kiritimatiellia bacterium]